MKTILSKLKGQLDEMKSRVQFLSLVKKYLQVSLWAGVTPGPHGFLGYNLRHPSKLSCKNVP